MAEQALEDGRGVLCIPDARWLRWCDGVLEVGDGGGPASTVAVAAEHLTLVGHGFAALGEAPGDGRRLALAARFSDGATVLVERRGQEIAVAASPRPRPKTAG